MEKDTNLAGIRKDITLKENCIHYGVNYKEPTPNETKSEKETQMSGLDSAIRRERKWKQRMCRSPNAKEKEREQKRKQREQLSPEARKHDKERKQDERSQETKQKGQR